MGDFSDPINKMKGELEDLHLDIDIKDKEISELEKNIKDLERKKELTEMELDELREQESRLMRDIERIEINS